MTATVTVHGMTYGNCVRYSRSSVCSWDASSSRGFETTAVLGGGIVLLCVAAHMLNGALADEDEIESLWLSSTRGAMLAGSGISTDELAINFPMRTSGLPIPETIAAIGAQAVARHARRHRAAKEDPERGHSTIRLAIQWKLKNDKRRPLVSS